VEPQHLRWLFDDQSSIESAALAPRTPKRFATSNVTEMWVKIRASRPHSKASVALMTTVIKRMHFQPRHYLNAAIKE
jgi:hypothetical protein